MRLFISTIIALLLAINTYADEFSIKSKSFNDQSKIPVIYSCDGQNITPELHWLNPPANTKTYAIIMDSPDAPMGVFYSWVLYNIPVSTTELPEGALLPEEIEVGGNSIGDPIYRGPCPPDDLPHHYVITIYALNAKLISLPSAPSIDEILPEIRRHTIKTAKLTGLFAH